MEHLKLIALDAEDLEVISAHLQDAVMRVGDMTYLPREQRFALVLNRFNWEQALEQRPRRRQLSFERRRTGLHFNRVRKVKVRKLNPRASNAVVELLAIRFEENDPPGGHIELMFAGGGTIRLDVECIEVALRDLGGSWSTDTLPAHAVEEDNPAEPGRETQGQ
jgi:Protein of unknown function (DUF2948)